MQPWKGISVIMKLSLWTYPYQHISSPSTTMVLCSFSMCALKNKLATHDYSTAWVMKRCLFHRYVLECPNCGIIFRSRQYWMGNQDPEGCVVRPEVKHVWPGVRPPIHTESDCLLHHLHDIKCQWAFSLWNLNAVMTATDCIQILLSNHFFFIVIAQLSIWLLRSSSDNIISAICSVTSVIMSAMSEELTLDLFLSPSLSP